MVMDGMHCAVPVGSLFEVRLLPVRFVGREITAPCAPVRVPLS